MGNEFGWMNHPAPANAQFRCIKAQTDTAQKTSRQSFQRPPGKSHDPFYDVFLFTPVVASVAPVVDVVPLYALRKKLTKDVSQMPARSVGVGKTASQPMRIQ
jgi:hypothetical protein